MVVIFRDLETFFITELLLVLVKIECFQIQIPHCKTFHSNTNIPDLWYVFFHSLTSYSQATKGLGSGFVLPGTPCYGCRWQMKPNLPGDENPIIGEVFKDGHRNVGYLLHTTIYSTIFINFFCR